MRFTPPANTVKVSAAWKQKFRSVCRPLRLIRMALREMEVSHQDPRASQPSSPDAVLRPHGAELKASRGDRGSGEHTPRARRREDTVSGRWVVLCYVCLERSDGKGFEKSPSYSLARC